MSHRLKIFTIWLGVFLFCYAFWYYVLKIIKYTINQWF